MKPICGHSGKAISKTGLCLKCHKTEYQKRPEVREKIRWHVLWFKYRITKVEYQRILAKQGGGCAVCGIHPDGQFLAVDHNHETGEVRGLLCLHCNLAIGHLDESIGRVKMLLRYLTK